MPLLSAYRPGTEAYRTLLDKLSSGDIWIERVPQDDITEEMCWIALKYARSGFKHIPRKFITQEMVNRFWDQESDLDRIPWGFRTYDICLKLVKKTPSNLEKVPKQLITQEMCDLACKGYNGKAFYVFNMIPDEFKTHEMCKEAARENRNIVYKLKIPRKYYTDTTFHITDRHPDGREESRQITESRFIY